MPDDENKKAEVDRDFKLFLYCERFIPYMVHVLCGGRVEMPNMEQLAAVAKNVRVYADKQPDGGCVLRTEAIGKG